MSIWGIMLCQECNEMIHLQKIKSNNNGEPIDFVVGSAEEAEVLGSKMRQFVAHHLRHSLTAVDEVEFDRVYGGDFNLEYVDEKYGDNSWLETNELIRKKNREIRQRGLS